MRISIVSDEGTTVYSESVAKTSEATGDFATKLQDEALTIADKYSNLSAANADGRTMTLEDMLNEAASTYNIDVNYLKAVAKLESNFNPDDVSSSGAIGIMQLMPSTAEGLGVEDPYDPYQNIMGGAKYLRKMLDQFGGDYELAYAAYNAGPGTVTRAGGIPQNNETPKAVALVMKYYNEGVDVPNKTYNVNAGKSSEVSSESTASKAQVAKELAEKLAEFPNHTSYEFFVQEMQKQSNSTDASNAYENLLSQANIAIKSMLNS